MQVNDSEIKTQPDNTSFLVSTTAAHRIDPICSALLPFQREGIRETSMAVVDGAITTKYSSNGTLPFSFLCPIGQNYYNVQNTVWDILIYCIVVRYHSLSLDN